MLYISLGSNCYVSWVLRKIGFQQKSYPFDWINSSSLSAIPFLLNNGFASVISNWKKSDFIDDLNLGLLNNKFLVKNLSLRFPHEYDVDAEISLNDIISRYERRFARMGADVAVNPVVFIRNVEIGYGNYPFESSISYSNIEDLLYQTLTKFCGHSNFVVIFFSRAQIFNYSPSYKNFYLINGCVPFENGFYEFNDSFLVGQVIFDFYKKFFDDFSILYDCDFFPSPDNVKKLYKSGCYSVLSSN